MARHSVLTDQGHRPPKSKGDYAFITHMIESAREGSGRVGVVVVPHGVLFRGAAEGKIRQKCIRNQGRSHGSANAKMLSALKFLKN